MKKMTRFDWQRLLAQALHTDPASSGSRNGTPGYLSDEFEDIETRVENPYGEKQLTEAGKAYLEKLRAALSADAKKEGKGEGIAALLSALSAQGAAGRTTAPARAKAAKKTELSEKDGYRRMLDALVRGSKGGMLTSAGLADANAVHDLQMEKGSSAQKNAYRRYAAYRGNTLARDKAYAYLNRLLKK